MDRQMPNNTTNSTYLDKEGLSKLVTNIKNTYARKDTLDTKEQNLRDYIDAEILRAGTAENTLDTKIDNEILRAQTKEAEFNTRAVNEEQRIEGLVGAETARATSRENAIEASKNELATRVTSLEAGKVADVRLEGRSVVDGNNVAWIALSDVNPEVSIFVMRRADFPAVGLNSKLYIDRDTSVIWQWDANNNEYIEAGKFNVLLVDELPNVGDPQVLYIKSSDHSINIYVGGDDPATKWQEISGQDKELRREFEGHGHTLSDISDRADLHLDWSNIDNKPEVYTPATHNHDDAYYTKQQVDTKITQSSVSPTDLANHKSDSHPHPTLEAALETSLATKASTSMVMTHINNTTNPHGVTAAQVGLGNVDNTSDLNKPISLFTQAALNGKADYDWTLTELAGKLGEIDVVDNLYTSQSGKPLSAKQGVILDEKLLDLDTRMQALGAALVFKGTVPSVEYLNLILNPSRGDSYQINSGEGEADDGAMYAWGGNDWVQIIAAATDLSSLIATEAEVHSIIDDYS